MNYINPYELKPNTEGADVIETFKHFVVNYYSSHNGEFGDELIVWLTMVSDVVYWMGLKKESELLDKWDALKSQYLESLIFTVYNNVILSTIFHIGDGDVVLEEAKRVLRHILSLYPTVSDADAPVKYDMSVETKIDMDAVESLVENNHWLAYLALFTTLTHMDLRCINLNRVLLSNMVTSNG